MQSRLAAGGITDLFPVQKRTFQLVTEGKDIVVRSRTGSGKTLAFVLPVSEKLKQSTQRSRSPRCVVVAPTRELANQIGKEFAQFSPHLSVVTVYGGMGFGPQLQGLNQGCDVVVGTPGRMMDLIEQGALRLNNIEFSILDEADEMLSMGFQQDIETIFDSGIPEGAQVSAHSLRRMLRATSIARYATLVVCRISTHTLCFRLCCGRLRYPSVCASCPRSS
jgi:ATP-dependent RNA helicase DDX21